MPEGYTHVRTARQAAQLAEIMVPDREAFACGANGPDVLFCYRVWRKAAKRGENLPLLGDRLHDENTGVFLQSLIEQAKTPQERSYVLGFLCHYATDCVVHPYVVTITRPGQLYGMAGGHGYFEIALDSVLHKRDTGKGSVPVQDTTPLMSRKSCTQAAALLQTALQKTLGQQVSLAALQDTFAHTRLMRSLFVSRLRLKYGLFWLVEPLFGGRGFITGHVTPAHLRGGDEGQGLPQVWKNPFTHQQQTETVWQLLEQAAHRSAQCMKAAQQVWDGNQSMEQAMECIGSNSYLSGLPDERSAPAQQG